MIEIEQPKIEKIVCPNQKDAESVCCNPKCQLPGVTCFVKDCNCRQAHKKCRAYQIATILQTVVDGKKNIPQQATKSFVAIEKIIQGMIKELTGIKDELYKARRQFGLRKFQDQFYNHVLKKQFDKINGKLVDKVDQQFEKGQKPKINKEIDIKASWEYYNSNFKKICQELRKYFEIINEKNLTGKVDNPSKITDQYAQLQEWIVPSFNKPITQFKLLYRASQHNFKISQFHSRCASTANTLVLIKTQFDKIIGGFNPFAWTTPGNGQYYQDSTKKTFIFSLSLKQKMFNFNAGNAFYYNTGYGPTFGGGHDIYISDNANTSGSSYCNFPHSYNNGLHKINQQTYKNFCGQTNNYSFNIVQWEVYQII